jgi:hypothetical protein
MTVQLYDLAGAVDKLPKHRSDLERDRRLGGDPFVS